MHYCFSYWEMSHWRIYMPKVKTQNVCQKDNRRKDLFQETLFEDFWDAAKYTYWHRLKTEKDRVWNIYLKILEKTIFNAWAYVPNAGAGKVSRSLLQITKHVNPSIEWRGGNYHCVNKYVFPFNMSISFFSLFFARRSRITDLYEKILISKYLMICE